MRSLLFTLFPTLAIVPTALSLPGLTQRSESRSETHITRNGSKLYLGDSEWRAVGANVYWLGLDENVTPPEGEPFYEPLKASYPTKGRITEIMAIMEAMGATMIRAHTLGVSVGNPLSLMPERQVINEKAFETIDWAVYQAGLHGIRLMVPLVDNYDYYHGGRFTFLRFEGHNLTSQDSTSPEVMLFYTDPSVRETFHFYITALLTHVNPHTNLTYAEDPTIFAFETGNELNGNVWNDAGVPTEWLRDIAQLIKKLAPRKLVVDGTYGINTGHFDVEEVDIFSNHYYPASFEKLHKDLDSLSADGRPYFIGEYDWLQENGNGADLGEWFAEIEKTEQVLGNAFWSLFGRNVPICDEWVPHGDGFTLEFGNPANSEQVKRHTRILRKHFVKMSRGEDISLDEPIPVVPCPADD